MKKTLVSILLITGVLFAQNNTINGNINTNGGDVNFVEDNSYFKKQSEINKNINSELLNLSDFNLKQDEKFFLTALLGQAKKINKEKISISAKNEECKFRAEASAKILKFANVKLAFTYCDKIF